MVTASALQLHPDCKVIVDEAAAKRLRGRIIPLDFQKRAGVAGVPDSLGELQNEAFWVGRSVPLSRSGLTGD